jgi:hypothetical protein
MRELARLRVFPCERSIGAGFGRPWVLSPSADSTGRMTTIFPLLRTGWTPSICEVTDSEFQKLLTDYRSFEEKVGRVMQRICEPFCRVCPTPCCRVDICREAAESPFLLAVHGATQRFDPKKGYLGCTGCRLKAGRPPVCHAFVCDKIFKAQPGDERKYALDCLSDLVGFVGKKVSQGRQMVEAMSETHLQASNLPLFQNRLSTATAALTALDSYFTRGDALGEVGMALLGKIRASPITFRRA